MTKPSKAIPTLSRRLTVRATILTVLSFAAVAITDQYFAHLQEQRLDRERINSYQNTLETLITQSASHLLDIAHLIGNLPASVELPVAQLSLLGKLGHAQVLSTDGQIIRSWNLDETPVAPDDQLKMTGAQKAQQQQAPYSVISCQLKCAQHTFVPTLTDAGQERIVSVSRELADVVLAFHEGTGADLALLLPNDGNTTDKNRRYLSNWNMHISALTRVIRTLPVLEEAAKAFDLAELDTPTLTPANGQHFRLQQIKVDNLDQKLVAVLILESNAPLVWHSYALAVNAVWVLLTALVVLWAVGYWLRPWLQDQQKVLTFLLQPPPQIDHQPPTLDASSEMAAIEHALKQSVRANTQFAEKLASRLQSSQFRTRSADQSREFLYELLEGLPILIFIYRNDGTVLYLNRFCNRTTGWNQRRLEGREFWTLFRHTEMAPTSIAELLVLNNGRLACTDHKRLDVNLLHEQLDTPFFAEPVNLTIAVDQGEQLELEQRLRWQASHDALTRAFNGPQMNSLIRQELLDSRLGDTHGALLYLDIDHFHHVREHHGRTIADSLLRQYAAHLDSLVGDNIQVGRYSGSEFMVLLPSHELHMARELAEQIQQTLAQQTFLAGREAILLETSIGLACYPLDGDSLQLLVQRADMALHQAKSAGGNRVQVYTTDSQ